MTARSRPLRAVVVTAIGIAACALLTMCRSATQITITIVTDVDCAEHPSTLVTVGDLHAIEPKPGAASSSACDPASSPHRVGTLVITPSGALDAEIAFKVVEASGQSADSCKAPDYTGCIVARRALRFLPHANLEVNVAMLRSCKDKPCGEAQTCVSGACQSALCNAESGGCNDVALVDAGVVDSGVDGIAETGDGAAHRCKGNAGPSMVRFDVASASSSFCIDATEVTNDDFNRFLAAPGTLSLPPDCADESVGTLPGAVTGTATLERPRTQVSMCSAWAYCAWAGKRLCGTVGGGRALNTGSASNEWVYACSNGSGAVYPYGPVYAASVCNTENDGGPPMLGQLVDVASRTSCHGVGAGFSQIFDMSGNASEMDSYIGTIPFDDAGTREVEARGGGVTDGVSSTCGTEVTFGQYNDSFTNIGFRCCSDATP